MIRSASSGPNTWVLDHETQAPTWRSVSVTVVPALGLAGSCRSVGSNRVVASVGLEHFPGGTTVREAQYQEVADLARVSWASFS